MSQYSSRIHIKVSSPEVWRKFEERDDAGFGLAKWEEQGKTSFIIDGEWSSFEEELTGVVVTLAKTLGKDGVIIADTTNINVDPYNYCIYYLGGDIRTREFSIDKGIDKCKMSSETRIDDIPGWLNYGGFRVTEEEKKVLLRCGVSVIGKRFIEFSTDFIFPDRVYLRETSFAQRPETIEKTRIGEKVSFVHSGDTYDPLRIEVFSELGSLGYLPSNISDKLTPVLLGDRLRYTAKVEELVPATKRNKHARSSIVAISINAEIKMA